MCKLKNIYKLTWVSHDIAEIAKVCNSQEEHLRLYTCKSLEEHGCNIINITKDYAIHFTYKNTNHIINGGNRIFFINDKCIIAHTTNDALNIMDLVIKDVVP